jgi:hypothetical protein
MPWISKRALAEQAAAMTRLRRDVRETNADNARLAQQLTRARHDAATAREALDTARSAVTAGHRKLIAEIELLRRDNRGLRQQLDHALGYGAEELAAIEAGETKPREIAAAK